MTEHHATFMNETDYTFNMNKITANECAPVTGIVLKLIPRKWGLRSRVVCVCVFSSHSFWTSSSWDVPAGVTQEEDHTGFFIHLYSAVRALLFLARRIQPFLSLVDREVEFCVLTI